MKQTGENEDAMFRTAINRIQPLRSKTSSIKTDHPGERESDKSKMNA